MTSTEDKKKKFMVAFKECKAIVTVSCITTGISRQTFYNWMENDEAFKLEVEDARELQIDFVESKLLDMIEAGDTTAIIFYLKTRGKNRGYNEKIAIISEKSEGAPNISEKQNISSENVEKCRNAENNKEIKRMVSLKISRIKNMLKKQKKYSAELDEQIKLAAQLIVRTDSLSEDIFSKDHKAVITEISREGNTREIPSQAERVYLLYQREAQRALRALGMNVDAKERKQDDDSFNEFMDSFKKER